MSESLATDTAESSVVASATTAGRPRRKGGGMFAPLRYHDYRLLFLGQLISALGDAFYIVALRGTCSPWAAAPPTSASR